jgi:flagellin
LIRNILLLGVAVAATAGAQNLVQNGSFSTGNFTGWTTHTCGAACSAQGWNVTSFPNDPGTPPPGATAAAINRCVGAACNDPINGDTISQTLTTVAGQTYTLTFYYDGGVNSSTGRTQLDVLWNGSIVTGGSIINATSNTWKQYTFTVVATGTSTVLEFTGRQDPATLYLANISVTAGGSLPVTPIPSTLLLMITGLATVGLYQVFGKRLRQA